MAKAVSSPILQLIRRVAADQRVQHLSDHDLLQRFGGQRDEAAFHALLLRHGPMVLEVCRGVLGNEADAEDAFQATFLILTRKAASIRKTASVGSWLHGVAYRTALKSRAQLATRQKNESRAPVGPNSEPDDLTWREVRQVLHEELSGLAERYRVPLVACYLEGKTQDEAAAQLGLAKTTLKERLERARSMLRARLVRRGLGPAAVLVATAWPSATALACLSETLVSSTIKAASLFAAGQAAAIPVQVTALTEGVLKTMLLTKLRIATAVLVVVALIGAGVIGAAMPGPQAVARSPIDGQKGDKALAAVPNEKPATGPVEKKTDQSTPDVRILKGHSCAVYFAAFSPNGERLVTAAKGVMKDPRADELIIWDVTAQWAKHKIQFTDPVNIWSMTLSADGKTLAVGTGVGIELRDAETGKVKHMLKGPWALSTGPCSLAFAPNGKTLAAGGSARDNTVRQLRRQRPSLRRFCEAHDTSPFLPSLPGLAH